MWKYHCLSILMLGAAAFVESAPMQDYDTDYNSYSGYFPNVGKILTASSEELQTLEFIPDPCPVGQMFQSELGICIDYSQGKLLPPQQYSPFPADETILNDAPVIKDQSSVVKLTMDDWVSTVNHGCKSTENYISELDICMEELVPEVFVPSTDEDKGPITSANLRASSSVTKLTKDDWGTNHGCKSNQMYLSELDICYTIA